MFEVLIREAGARFGLDNKAGSVVQVLLAEMTNKEKGGLAGFLEPFKAAGFGPIIQSWLGGGPSAQPIGNRQIEEVLGTSGGLLQTLTARLDVDRDSLTSALGYLLPALVGKLSIGGSMPSHYPPEVLSLAEAGQQLLAAPIVEVPASGGFMKWLPWLVLIAAIAAGVAYWNANRDTASAPVAAPAPTISAPLVESAPAAAPVAEQPDSPLPAAASDAPTSADAAAPASADPDQTGDAQEVQPEPEPQETDIEPPASGEASSGQD